MKSFKLDDPVYVYRNLHKKCYSVCQNGVVVAHLHRVFLKDCVFLCGLSGRDKVRETGRKNVHARIKGRLFHPYEAEPKRKIVYNPYKNDFFQDEKTGLYVKTAKFVRLSSNFNIFGSGLNEYFVFMSYLRKANKSN